MDFVEEDSLRRQRTSQEEVEDENEELESVLPVDFDDQEIKLTHTEDKNWIIAEVKLLLILTFFAILGVLARKGLIVLTSYNGSFLGGVIWANFAACTVMGMLIQSNSFWLYAGSEKSKVLVYTGLTTGFCGTLSSFSSSMLEAFEKSANIEAGSSYHYPNKAYGIMQALAVLISHFTVSICGLHLGKHSIKNYEPPAIHFNNYLVLEYLVLVGGLLAWIAVALLMMIKGWRAWMFSCIMAPFGCWQRYYVSKLLNKKIKSFPLGTFTVNVTGTIMLAIFTLLNRGKLHSSGDPGRIVGTKLSCQILQGLSDGYCGALTTVSTFVVELYILKNPRSYKYGIASIIVAYCMMVLILGSYNWTIGLTDPLCS